MTVISGRTMAGRNVNVSPVLGRFQLCASHVRDFSYFLLDLICKCHIVYCLGTDFELILSWVQLSINKLCHFMLFHCGSVSSCVLGTISIKVVGIFFGTATPGRPGWSVIIYSTVSLVFIS